MQLIHFFQGLPSRLARVTSGGKIIREIDGLRFVAIFLVVMQHLSERFTRNTPIAFKPGVELDIANYVTSHGFIGVHIFFVISGFILGLPFASYYLYGGREISLGSYFWRRVTRLEPPYIISLTVIATSILVLGYSTWTELWPHFVASVFYVHSLIYGSWSTINPPVWSLEVEVQFYIMAPFLAMLFFKINNTLVRRTILLSFIFFWMILQQLAGFEAGYSLFSLFAHLHLFLAGFLLVDIYLVDWKDGIKRSNIFNFVAILAFGSALYFWTWNHYLLNRIIFAVSVFVLVYAIFRATWVNRFITLPWITAIGGMCYSIYLIHLPILELYVKASKHIVITNIFTINYVVQFALMVPVLLTISIIFYLLIEKPCMYKDWPQKLVAHFKGSSVEK